MNTDPKPSINLDSTISLDEEERICKSLSCSEFSEACSRLNYKQLCQINNELNLRLSRISQQVDMRSDPDSGWRRRANSAIRIIDQKIQIISNRLNMIRDNNVHLLISSIGGMSAIADKRLVLIKCLLHIIEHNHGFSGLTQEEDSIIDLCRQVAGSPRHYQNFSYNIARNAIVSQDGTEIATITSSGVHAEELGYLMARAWDLADLLDSLLPFIKSMSEDECSFNEFCRHCRAKMFNSKILNILSEVR